MRIAVLCLFFVGSPAIAAAVPDTEAGMQVGHNVTVDCAVANVYTSRGGTTFVNCGAPYPSQTFSFVVFRNSNVGDLTQYQGKHLLVHGMVKLYNGKPEIILASQSQIIGSR